MYRIDFGHGYRVYFARDGDERIRFLSRGTKVRQKLNVEKSRDRWRKYPSQKWREERTK